MRSRFILGIVLSFAWATAWTQSATQSPERNTPPPRSDSQPQLNDEGSESAELSDAIPSNAQSTQSPNDSSSRSTLMDLSPPTGDLQDHPNSDAALDQQGVNEMHPWNPHRAEKDIEVGDYYLREKNYRGAEGRYRDALIYKPNDAVATYHLAEIMERTARPEEAREFYTAYLKILPRGPKAEDARKALEKLQAAQAK
jgi:tetratricopeptide (TPR) repeat protein